MRPRPAAGRGSGGSVRFETSGTIGVPNSSTPRRSMVIEKLGQIGEGRKKKQVRQTPGLVNTYAPQLEDLSGPELAAKTTEFRERLESGETLEDGLPEAVAGRREAAG